MKITTNKFKDSFYLPVKNTSCIENVSYEVLVDDQYGLVSIPNTFGPGPLNKIFISVPKVPSLLIQDNGLVAKKIGNSYYLTIYPSDTRFISYPVGKRFYIFFDTGFYSGIEVDFYGYEDSVSPLFSISEASLRKLLPVGQSLPTQNSSYTFPNVFYISTDPETSNFLNVITSTSTKTRQTANVTIKNDSSFYSYEFTVDPFDAPVVPVDQPPIGMTEKKTSQLMRSFVPISSIITLQLDSEGRLFMDKLSSGSDFSQKGYRRRCTNLGFEKDVASFSKDIPRQSLYSFSDEDIDSSSTQFSDQYFTDTNIGVSINKETQEKLRYFAPLWLKDRVPNYFLIFRKSALSSESSLMEGASLVTAIDIHKSELGPYLEKLKNSSEFSLAPLEVSIDNSYSLTWNGVSLDTGYWVNHKEFIDIDIQQGISDYEFNEIISGGFSRGSIINPQFLNIEFLFDDNSADVYNIYQYFGLYSDEIEISSFLPDIDSTQSLFKQSETRSSSNKDFNSAIISNPNGVKLAVDLNDNPDKLFNINDPSILSIGANSSVQSRYLIKSLDTQSGNMRFEISSDVDLGSIDGLLTPGSQLRIETDLHDFIGYVVIKSVSYNSVNNRLTINIQDSIELLNTPSLIWVNVFDVNPGSIGRIRLDSSSQEKCKCIVLSKVDSVGDSISEWINNVVDQDQKLKDSIVLFDKSSGSYLIMLAESVIEEEDYFKVYVDVLESNGTINPNGQVFMHISEYDIDGSVPGPKIINSSSRKFILKTKDQLYSVKHFDFINDQNKLLGKFDLDSTSFNLSQITGLSANSSIPVVIPESIWNGLDINFGESINTVFGEGDRIEIQQIIGNSTKTWSLIKSDTQNTEITHIPGTVTEISIISMTSGNQYTEVEISSDDYVPSQFDLFCVTDSVDSPSLILDFLRAEANQSGTYTLVFGNPNVSTNYSTLQVKILESQSTYFNYSSNETIASNIAASIQRFKDCPLKAAASNGGLLLYSEDKTSQFTIKVFASPGMINTFLFNGAYQKPISVFRQDEILSANYYSYEISPIYNEKIYSIEPSFIQKIKDGSQILSKSGTPSSALKWSNGIYSVTDIKSSIEEGKNRVLIKFRSGNEPSLLDNRIQIFDDNRLTLSLLSFYDVVDLDLFDEIPARPVKEEEELSQRSSVYLSGSSLFSSSFLKQKNFYLTVDIVENMFSQWKDWDPVNGGDFYFELPLTYSFSSKFIIESQDQGGVWKNYPIQINPATIYPVGISSYVISAAGGLLTLNPDSDSQASIFSLNSTIEAAILLINQERKTQPSLALTYIGHLKTLMYFLYQNYQDSNFSSSITRNTSINISRINPYLYSQGFTLNITDTEKNFRYSTSLLENTYTVKEESTYDNFIGFGGPSTTNRTVNFIGSLDKSSGKFKPKVGRWKERSSSSIDGTPYLLNVDPLMSPYDLFVNVSQEDAAPENFSFDWYLISGWPKSIELKDFNSNYRYLARRIDETLLQSLEYDYFSQYFTVGKGLEKTSDGQERGRSTLWTEIFQSPDGYKTIFRGFPLIFRTDLDLTGVRFAAVLQVDEGLDTPSKVSLIYNQQWKTITLFVQIDVNNYTIDGSIPLVDLYTLQNNRANTDISSILYSPVFLYSAKNLEFDITPRIYNIKVEEITSIPTDAAGADDYQYNRYTYNIEEKTEVDQSRPGDIELFGVSYVPDADYTIKCDLFLGTPDKVNVTFTIPKSRIRGVFDTNLQRYRVFIDQIFEDSFFGVLSDIETGPRLLYATFSKKNTIVFNNKETQIYNASVSAIGSYPTYRTHLKEISAGSILDKLYDGEFSDISISKDGYVSRSGIEFSSKAPSILRPTKFKRGALDTENSVSLIEEQNVSNLFRLDGAFEPSYDKIIEYSAAEDLTLTRQFLNSFNGANTDILTVNDIFIWYRRVSVEGVSSGFININDTTVNFPFPIGRRTLSPLKNTWSNDFYLLSTDEYVDDSRGGLENMKDSRFFLSSKAMVIPTYFKTFNFSVSDLGQAPESLTAVQWIQTGSRLTISVDFDKIIESYLFNAGVFNYFQTIFADLETDKTFYELTKEYIAKNLLDKYYVTSIDVYSKPYQITQVVSSETDPELTGFFKADVINIESRKYFEFSVPVDKSQQIALTFNINRI